MPINSFTRGDETLRAHVFWLMTRVLICLVPDGATPNKHTDAILTAASLYLIDPRLIGKFHPDRQPCFGESGKPKREFANALQ